MNSSLTPELFGFIQFMVDDERTILLQLPLGPTVAMAAIIAISIVWSNAMKVFIYHSLAQEKLADRPINVLILVDQVTFELPSLIFSNTFFVPHLFPVTSLGWGVCSIGEDLLPVQLSSSLHRMLSTFLSSTAMQ